MLNIQDFPMMPFPWISFHLLGLHPAGIFMSYLIPVYRWRHGGLKRLRSPYATELTSDGAQCLSPDSSPFCHIASMTVIYCKSTWKPTYHTTIAAKSEMPCSSPLMPGRWVTCPMSQNQLVLPTGPGPGTQGGSQLPACPGRTRDKPVRGTESHPVAT